MKVNEIYVAVKIEISGFYYHSTNYIKNKYYCVCALKKTHNCQAKVVTVRTVNNHYVEYISGVHNHHRDEYSKNMINSKCYEKLQSNVAQEQSALVTSGSEEQPSTSGEIINPQQLRYTTAGNQLQLIRLVESLKQNPDVAKGTCSKALKRETFKALSIELNALGPPQRKWNEWFKAWVEWKKKFRTKSACTPGKPFIPERHLTELEQTAIKLMYFTYPCRISAVSSDEESELSDDDEEHVIAIESDEETENIFKESLVENDAVRNEPMSPCCADFEDYNKEYPTLKCEPSSPGIIKQDFSEAETVEVIERDEEEVKLERCDSSESLEGHVEEFLNMKRQLLAAKESYQKIMKDQNLVEKEFYSKILNLMGEIKSSSENIEGYMKISLEENDALIEMEKETLEAYKQASEDIISLKKAKLKLKFELLENKRRKLDDLMVEKES